jgi:histidyl-tRNA synthetase
MDLRRQGIACDTDLLGRSLKSQMREADRQQAASVLVVGAAEIASGSATLKNMSTGMSANIALAELASAVRATL